MLLFFFFVQYGAAMAFCFLFPSFLHGFILLGGVAGRDGGRGGLLKRFTEGMHITEKSNIQREHSQGYILKCHQW